MKCKNNDNGMICVAVIWSDMPTGSRVTHERYRGDYNCDYERAAPITIFKIWLQNIKEV